jgi:hypothetical protein
MSPSLRGEERSRWSVPPSAIQFTQGSAEIAEKRHPKAFGGLGWLPEGLR